MSLIIILSITIRLAAMGWSIVLLRRMRDWRMGFLTAMLGLMALRQTLTLLMTRESWSISFTAQATEMPGLVVSILAFAAVIFLERIIMEEEKVKKEMRESEERSRLLLDSTAEGIYGLDLQGNCTFCNPACLRLLGYEDVEDLLGKNVHELIHHTRPDGSPYPEEECRIYQAFRQGKGTHVDDEVLWRADGTSFPAEYWSYPIRRNGELIGSVVTFLDITERRQAEEALHKTSRALKVLGSCNSALVRATEESELLREVCRVIVEVGGYRLAWVGFAEQDEEKSVRPVAQAGYEQGYLETLNITWADTERGRGPTGTAIRTREPCVVKHILTDPRFEPWRAEAVKRGYASSIALPLLTNDQAFGALNVYAAEPDAFDQEEVDLLEQLASDLAYGIIALRTRAEHKQAEEALRMSEAKYRELVQNANSIILRMDTSGRITFFNEFAQSFFGYTEEEILGKNVVGTIVPEIDSSGRNLATMVEDIGRRPELYASSESENMRRDGERIWVAWTNKAIYDEEGRISEVLCVGNDITERRQAEEELRRAHEELKKAYADLEQAQATAVAAEKMAALGRLTAGVSHEILNPLNVITMRLHMMLADPEVSRKSAEDLRDMQEQAQRIVKISQDLLFFARHRPPERRELDLNELVNRTIGLLKYELRLANIAAELGLARELPPILADQDQLQQVVLNLLTNA